MVELREQLQQFHQIANAPKKQFERYLLEGKKVILCVPELIPEELIHAMGMIPFGAWGGDIEIKEAKAYFPSFICSILQSILELGIKGTFNGASGIIVPYLCDSLKCLGENWKYAVPNIELIPLQYPQNRMSEAGKEFAKASYQRVIKMLERISGETFEDQLLRQSVLVYNEHNQAMKQLMTILKNDSILSPRDRNAIFKSAYFMEKSEHTQWVKALLVTLEANVKENQQHDMNPMLTLDKPKIKIVTSGILADAESLLTIFKENQLQIVADNIVHESVQYQVDTKNLESPMDGLSEKYTSIQHCSVLYDVSKSRGEHLVNLVEENDAKGIIFVMTKFCDPEEFDVVIVRRQCEKKEIPMLVIEVDRQMVNYEQVRTAVQTFVEMIQ